MISIQKLGYSWALGMLLLFQAPDAGMKGYAFYRPILGGVRPGRIVEEGAAAESGPKEQAKAQYFLYVLSPQQIEQRDTAALWVEGKRVPYQLKQVSLPVIQPSGMFPGQSDTLLAQKSGYAYQLVLTSSGLQLSAKEARPSGIEWQYRKKGKTHRCVFAAWIALSPLALP